MERDTEIAKCSVFQRSYGGSALLVPVVQKKDSDQNFEIVLQKSIQCIKSAVKRERILQILGAMNA